MKTQERNKAWAAFEHKMRQQGREKAALVIMPKGDHAAINKKAKLDIERIAQAAGVEVLKTARIGVRRGMRKQQEIALKELNKLLQDIRAVKDRESAVTQTGIATGYANAMRHFDLISENELKDVIEVIGQAGEIAVQRIEDQNRSFRLMRIFMRKNVAKHFT